MQHKKITLVFVHGWSVTDTDTYGGLPERLQIEAVNAGLELEIKQIFLGRYISFHDEVTLQDISRAFAAAVEDELSASLSNNNRFVCITHSTGGPVIRDWWSRYYNNPAKKNICPMSHLIMLAPANYGSALAQLGKGRLSRMKFWFGGVEPGQGVLDWLELGSQESWQLNQDWITREQDPIGAKGIFPFVVTGQSIDHAVYDHLNTYTGETGSDGVVRVAAANLQGQYIKLSQQFPEQDKQSGDLSAAKLEIDSYHAAPDSALCIIKNKSHSGRKMGIMRSVKKQVSDKSSQDTVEAILSCIKVSSKQQYNRLSQIFAQKNHTVQKQQQLEVVQHLLHRNSYFIHDKYSMLIFRVCDHQGFAVKDYDLLLTAGDESNPSHLPRGFFQDKQRNIKNPETISYYFNHDIMRGCEEIVDKQGKVVREKFIGIKKLGLKIIPRPSNGFVHYLPCEITATSELLEKALRANSTTLIEICLQRVVYKNVMRLDKGVKSKSFKKVKADGDIVDSNY